MADEAVAVALDPKDEPKDLADALVQLDEERKVSAALSEVIDNLEEQHAAALLRGDQLAGVAADLAPKVSQLSTDLAESQADLVGQTAEGDKLEDFLVRTIQTLEKHHVLSALPTDITAWWNERKAAVAARRAELRASALAKLTPEEIEALGLAG